MKTAAETARDIIIPTAGIAIAWDKAGLSSKDALRQLCEGMMERLKHIEQSGSHYWDGEKNRYSENGEYTLEQVEQELRAFCGVGEQTCAVDEVE